MWAKKRQLYVSLVAIKISSQTASSYFISHSCKKYCEMFRMMTFSMTGWSTSCQKLKSSWKYVPCFLKTRTNSCRSSCLHDKSSWCEGLNIIVKRWRLVLNTDIMVLILDATNLSGSPSYSHFFFYTIIQIVCKTCFVAVSFVFDCWMKSSPLPSAVSLCRRKSYLFVLIKYFVQQWDTYWYHSRWFNSVPLTSTKSQQNIDF